jgi:hypothetical protein
MTVTIYLECGCVERVTGLPDGWDYVVVDRDSRGEEGYCPECGGPESVDGKMIYHADNCDLKGGSDVDAC